ncbi:MAG: tetratricopeptide repeat protein [Gammaproteobacteria bacterium]|nr:tetratricopeptide repeat protein [Gammaproteobacteria bacterium]MDH3416109.1 tetratricopeptide repeat protein [Gammaproteobacteria bacterium]
MITLIVLVIIGFPVTVILTWIFDITPHGIRRTLRYSDEAAEAGDKPSIAVLPFVDMSPEQDQGFFCEGIAEEILNALSKVQQLAVAARSSSFLYSTGAADVRQIGRDLGVKTLLEGSVRKSGNQLRITAQLVKTADGYHIWSKSFDQELQDVFKIQDEIAKSIAEALLESLTPKQHSALRTKVSKDVGAYEYYLRGRQFFKRFRKTDIEYAQQMFRQAIDIDAEFAPAWAGYADCFSFLVMYADPLPGYAKQARSASKRALELDSSLAEAHASRGLAYLISNDFDAAEAEFEKALELNSRLFEAHYYFARTRFHQGRLEEAIELFKTAGEMDPTDYQSRCLRIQVLRGLGRDEEAVAESAEAIQVVENNLKWNPDDARAYHLGAGTLVVLGDTERAKRWLHRAIEIDPDDPVVLYNVACNLATLGELESAMEYLDAAVQHGTVSAAWMRNDEDLANLRSDPRYTRLLEQLESVAASLSGPNN